MKKLFLLVMLVVSFTMANATVNWGENAVIAYTAAYLICNNGPNGGDASHVQAANDHLSDTGVTYEELSAFATAYGTGWLSTVSMGTIWCMLHIGDLMP